MLFLIGTGLCDEKDLTLRAREAIDDCDAVYLEGYTSLLRCSLEDLQTSLGKPVTLLARTDVESGIEPILDRAKNANIAILVVGDPFGATTHTDLYLRARSKEVTIKVIHNASVLNAIGATGLELYRFGKTVSIPYWEKGFSPTSFLDGIAENLSRGLHTLCLLDIKADQHRFMSSREGIEQLQKAEIATGSHVLDNAVFIGVSRLGWPEQSIVVGTAKQMLTHDFSGPPQCLVVVGRLHPVEEEMLALWRL